MMQLLNNHVAYYQLCRPTRQARYELWQ